MINEMLRVADPAGDLVPDGESTAAQAMLREITSEPRAAARRSGSRTRLGRLMIGAALAVAAAVATIVLTVSSGSGPKYSSAAYTVEHRSDGSVRVVVHWSELHNIARLQAALNRAQARTVILTGDAVVNQPLPPTPPCARYRSSSYSSHAVRWDFPNPAAEVNGIVIRPHNFPKNGTFVIEIAYLPGTHDSTGMLSFMARGRVPTCIQPQGYTGPATGPTG